jgi:hypothetical protein
MKRLAVLAIAVLASGAAPAAADPPVMSGWPGNLTVEATSAAGATVNYTSPTATWNGKSIEVVCTPQPGSVFALGATNVNCKAAAESGETTYQSFSVTVVDKTPPAFTGASDRSIEATSSAGVTGYTAPTATDLVDGARPATCTPAPATVLAFGATIVRCTARDTRGNEATVTFTLTVRDTTAPVFENVPDDVHEEIDGKGPAAVAYDDPTASDAVDGPATVSCDPPSGDEFPLGSTTVTCTAADKAGNTDTAEFEVVVEDLSAPGPVASFGAKVVGKAVTLSWKLPSGDVKGTEITRLPGRNGAVSAVLYRGSARTYTDRAVVPGVPYRYRATSYDAAGNRSKSTVIAVIARSSALLAPADGQRLSSPPELRWAAVAGASYYNVQVYRHGRKVFTAWPKTPNLRLSSAWMFNKHREHLTRGAYAWYVWPGYGPLSLARYGELLGRSSFVIVRGPDPAAR